MSKGFCAAVGCNEAPHSKYGGYCLDHQFLVQAKTRQLAKANIGEQFYDAISSMIANGTLVDDELLNLATRWRQVVLSEPA